MTILLGMIGLSTSSEIAYLAKVIFGFVEGFIIDILIALYFLVYPDQFLMLWVPSKAMKASPFSQPASCALVRLFCLALLGLGMMQVQVFRLGNTDLYDSVMIPLAIGDVLHILIVMQFYNRFDAKLSIYLSNIVPTALLLILRCIYYFRM